MKRYFLLTVCLCFLFVPAYAKTFVDVPEDAPYSKAVLELSDMGVIAGRGNGIFDPGANVTRGEFSAYIARSQGFKDDMKSASLPFTDVPKEYWAVNVISYCFEKGYILGMGNGLFEPQRSITYEEVIKIAVCAAGLDNPSLTKEGEYWHTGYTRVAGEKGMLKNTEIVSGKPAPRSFAAMLIYNALNLSEEDVAPIEVEEPPAVVDKLVVIDAGHNNSGFDTGATGNGLKEQNITFKIAEKLKPILERNGFSVIMTRNNITDNLGEETVMDSLMKRAEIANEARAEIFVSIHCNAGGGTGTEAYILSEGGSAQYLASEVVKAVVAETGLKDRGVKTANFVVLRETQMPAILVETAFIDHALDAILLQSEEGQLRFAIAIAKGICAYKGVWYQ